jgi:two-component system sensor histidine kinase KdpD
MTEDPEPEEPEKQLAIVTGDEQHEHLTRGRLRVYLGAAPGVGKTFAMLNEGQRRKARGTDVVIGYIETYDRPLTIKAAEGLEVIPRRLFEYRGTKLEEMDTDAVIARNPTVALVDELAHTNAPGSKNEKRWQDVEEIVKAGITVITTLNIQHLESLKERVEEIAGIRVSETVPDWVVDQADDVELVDIAPEALRRRMVHGNIYPPDRAQRALQNFFRPGNLAALRELALRRTAEEAEDQLEQYMHEHDLAGWRVEECVLVCIDHRPISATLIRRAARMARGLTSPFLAIHINSKQLSQSDQVALEKNVHLARELGANIHDIDSDDVAAAIAQFALEHRVTQLIVGQTQRSRWYEFVHGSLIQDLLRRLPDLDIHVVAEQSDQKH